MEYVNCIWTQVDDFWQLMRHERVCPRRTSIYYNKQQLLSLFRYKNRDGRGPLKHTTTHLVVLGSLNLFFITVLMGLTESSDDILDFGQDILWAVGVFYILFKWHFFYFWINDIHFLIIDIDDCRNLPKNRQSEAIIHAKQRSRFLIESLIGLGWHVGIFVFTTLVLLQPVWTEQKLPFHVIYPFHWHDPSRHPIGHALIYLFQALVISFNMTCILYADLLSGHCMSQLAVNLESLCIELSTFTQECQGDEARFRAELRRLVAYHQRIINLAERTNRVFYAPLIMQMVCLFIMISLSTFEVLIARHNVLLAARFIFLMVQSFAHLAFFCFFGDMVTSQSEQVALAAYDAYEWSPNCKALRRDILFMISRAQRPILMAPSPFPPFNWFSYMSIIKQCYSILTLLLESLD